MNDLSKAERFKKCLNGGSEEHRAADCKATRKKDLAQQEPKAKPQLAQVSPSASSALPIVQATPLMSMDSFQIEASHAAAGVPPPAIAQVAAPVTPTPEGGGQHQPSPSPPQPAIHQTFGHRLYHACQLLSVLSLGVPKFGWARFAGICRCL